jgi:hypothetical protein
MNFSFRSLTVVVIWSATVLPVLVAGSVWLLVKDHEHIVSFIVAVSVAWVSWAAVNSILSNSDIRLDDRSIGRVIFGRTWQYYSWGEIRRIRVFPVSYPREKTVLRALNLFPTNPPKLRYYPSGKISFVEGTRNREEFLGLLNRYASQNNIPIDIVVDGIDKRVASIPPASVGAVRADGPAGN